MQCFLHIVLIAIMFNIRVIQSLAISALVQSDQLQQKLRQLASREAIIILDGDNIRGKTRFKLSKEDLCDSVEEWMAQNSLFGKVILMYDHASTHCGYFLPRSGLGVVFSGPGRSADDVISRDIAWFQRSMQNDVTVVTEDCGLKRRCKKRSRGKASTKMTSNFQRTSPVKADFSEGDGQNTLNDVKKITKADKAEIKLNFVGSKPYAQMVLNLFGKRSDVSSTDMEITVTSDSYNDSDGNIIEIGDTVGDIQFIETESGCGSDSPEGFSKHDIENSLQHNENDKIHPEKVQEKIGRKESTMNCDDDNSEDGDDSSVGSSSSALIYLKKKEEQLQTQLTGVKKALLRCNRKIALRLKTRTKDIYLKLKFISKTIMELEQNVSENSKDSKIQVTTKIPGNVGENEENFFPEDFNSEKESMESEGARLVRTRKTDNDDDDDDDESARCSDECSGVYNGNGTGSKVRTNVGNQDNINALDDHCANFDNVPHNTNRITEGFSESNINDIDSDNNINSSMLIKIKSSKSNENKINRKEGNSEDLMAELLIKGEREKKDYRPEETWERVIAAETFREKLKDLCNIPRMDHYHVCDNRSDDTANNSDGDGMISRVHCCNGQESDNEMNNESGSKKERYFTREVVPVTSGEEYIKYINFNFAAKIGSR